VTGSWYFHKLRVVALMKTLLSVAHCVTPAKSPLIPLRNLVLKNKCDCIKLKTRRKTQQRISGAGYFEDLLSLFT